MSQSERVDGIISRRFYYYFRLFVTKCCFPSRQSVAFITTSAKQRTNGNEKLARIFPTLFTQRAKKIKIKRVSRVADVYLEKRLVRVLHSFLQSQNIYTHTKGRKSLCFHVIHNTRIRGWEKKQAKNNSFVSFVLFLTHFCLASLFASFGCRLDGRSVRSSSRIDELRLRAPKSEPTGMSGMANIICIIWRCGGPEESSPLSSHNRNAFVRSFASSFVHTSRHTWQVCNRERGVVEMWELVSLYPKSFLTDGNALSTGEYPFETGEEEEKKKKGIQISFQKNAFWLRCWRRRLEIVSEQIVSTLTSARTRQYRDTSALPFSEWIYDFSMLVIWIFFRSPWPVFRQTSLLSLSAPLSLCRSFVVYLGIIWVLIVRAAKR